MKKIIVLLMFIPVFVFSQNNNVNLNTYQDAKELARLIELNNKVPEYEKYKTSYYEEYFKIITKYIGSKDYNDIITRNPFLDKREYFIEMAEPLVSSPPDNKNNNYDIKTKSYELYEYSGTSFTNLSSLSWQTAVLQGTADFMAERFKEELVNFGLYHLGDNMDKLKGLDTLFPNTITYIKNHANGVNYAGMLNQLRYNAEYDIRKLPDNLPKYLSNKIPSEQSQEIELCLNLVKDIKQISNPADAISFVADKYPLESNLYNELQLVNIMSNALRNTKESGKIWVKPSDINFLEYENNMHIRFFYGLLYEQLLQDAYLEKYASENELGKKVPELTRKLFIVQELFYQFNKKDKLTSSDFKQYASSLLSLYEPLMNSKSVKTANNILELSSIIEDKNYKLMVPHILNTCTDLGLDTLLEDTKTLRYLSFLVDLSLAENSEDVKELIKSVALPVGSSSIKRIVKHNISFNGYVGFTVGQEKMKLVDGNVEYYWNTGISAPIGLSFSKKISKTKPRSATLFLSALDLGALINLNSSDSVQTDKNISVEQFFAPGGALFYNFGKSPFSLGFHANYIPSIREYERVVAGVPTTVNHLGVWRFNISFLVDIPLFNLYYKDK